jgi:hypothetical protein
MPGVLPPPAPADPEVAVDADVLDAVAADGVRDQEPARCADPPDALGGSPVQRPDQVGDAEPPGDADGDHHRADQGRLAEQDRGRGPADAGEDGVELQADQHEQDGVEQVDQDLPE